MKKMKNGGTKPEAEKKGGKEKRGSEGRGCGTEIGRLWERGKGISGTEKGGKRSGEGKKKGAKKSREGKKSAVKRVFWNIYCSFVSYYR